MSLRTEPASKASRRGLPATAAVLVIAWALILGAVLGFGWLLTHPLQSSVDPWDNDVSRWFADQRSGTLDGPADVGTFLGDTIPAMALFAVVAVAFAAWKRSWRPLVFAGLLVAGVGGFYALATHLDPRDRPPVSILDPGLVPDASFPSGHVGTATAVYVGIALLAWVYAPTARRWVWVLLALPFVVLVARLYQGAHHLTDVLTSLTYASVWLAVLFVLVLRGHGPEKSS
ncbi:MAG: phosphatase PAP2 family protein [Nocardioides sp.]